MLRVATDVGGTFTDLAIYNEADGSFVIAKSLTTPDDPSRGVMDTLSLSKIDGAEAASFLHGTTLVINAITERKGVRTALVTTEGFRDILEIGRGNRPDLYNLRFHSPKPFVPRQFRFEVDERVSSLGDVVQPLNEDDVARVAEACRAAGIEAIAVMFLNSYRVPDHELRCAELLRKALPDIQVCASADITREWREYERASTAVLNAYAQPIVARYLANLEERLSAAKLTAARFAMQSNGGTASFENARRHPITLIESGPAGGIRGAGLLAQALGETRALYLDIGGTTAKCALVIDGQTPVTSDYRIERTRSFPGYPVRASVLDVVEIGAGGGSIAWFDRGDLLRVGPRSAGAMPGPACYQLGGAEVTLTDANLLTGRIGGENFAGNQLSLSRDAAAQALTAVEQRLGMGQEDAGLAVIRIAEAAMIEALKLVSIQRGYDPRDFVLIASGGGGPLHGASLGLELGVREILIPPYPGIFCAWGMLASEPYQDFARSHLLPQTAVTAETIEVIFAEITKEARGYFAESVSSGSDALTFERSCDLRYAGQEHSVSVACQEGDRTDQIIEAFHLAHRRAYTFSLTDTPVEFVSFRVRASAATARPGLGLKTWDAASDSEPVGKRNVRFSEGISVETPLYSRSQLPAGFEAKGPLAIEEPTATTLVHPDQLLRVDEFGVLHITTV